MSIHELEARILNLPRHDRAHLAQRLIESLDEGEDEISQAWHREIERRAAAHETGESQDYSLEEVFASDSEKSE